MLVALCRRLTVRYDAGRGRRHQGPTLRVHYYVQRRTQVLLRLAACAENTRIPGVPSMLFYVFSCQSRRLLYTKTPRRDLVRIIDPVRF